MNYAEYNFLKINFFKDSIEASEAFSDEAEDANEENEIDIVKEPKQTSNLLTKRFRGAARDSAIDSLKVLRRIYSLCVQQKTLGILKIVAAYFHYRAHPQRIYFCTKTVVN